MIRAGVADFVGQIDSLTDAFREFDRAASTDVYVERSMLRNLAVLVRDVNADDAAKFVEDRAERAEWTEHSKAVEFAVYHSIGWNYAMRGDHLAAFRNLRRSANCAPTIPLQIAAILDKAFLARELGEVMSAQDDLEHALKLAKQVDWSKAAGSQRTILCDLARRVAPGNADLAEALWNQYIAVKPSLPILQLSARDDRRQRALECSAQAAVLLASGQRGRAVSLLSESLEVWIEIDYSWHAAATALELAELTGEPRYITIVCREAEKRPNSWFARRLAKLKILETV